MKWQTKQERTECIIVWFYFYASLACGNPIPQYVDSPCPRNHRINTRLWTQQLPESAKFRRLTLNQGGLQLRLNFLALSFSGSAWKITAASAGFIVTIRYLNRTLWTYRATHWNVHATEDAQVINARLPSPATRVKLARLHVSKCERSPHRFTCRSRISAPSAVAWLRQLPLAPRPGCFTTCWPASYTSTLGKKNG